jgi:predicted RNA-binding Zn ribbon-like protein
VFHFHADRPVLDFLATLAERGTTDEEKLGAPADLAAWTVEAGLTTRPLAVSAAQLTAARALREAMYRVLCARIDGAAPRRADRDRINAAARPAPPTPRLTPAGELVRTGDVDAVLSLLARDCLGLLGGADGALLRRCDDARCTRLFLDRSRGHRRRWCGMQGCGDRAKAAAYRRRRRAARPA